MGSRMLLRLAQSVPLNPPLFPAHMFTQKHSIKVSFTTDR